MKIVNMHMSDECLDVLYHVAAVTSWTGNSTVFIQAALLQETVGFISLKIRSQRQSAVALNE